MKLYKGLLKLRNQNPVIVGSIAVGTVLSTIIASVPACSYFKRKEATAETTTEIITEAITEATVELTEEVTQPEETVPVSPYQLEEEMVNSTKEKIYSLNIAIDDDTVVLDSSLMLLLSLLAKEDENGKISAETINHFKSIVNVNTMINNYDTLLNKIENGMINNRFVYLSDVLPIELVDSKGILRNIENIAKHAYDNPDNKEIILEAFDKMYTLFVEEKELDGFKVRDLPYSLRAAASSYAREVTLLARNYASNEKLNAMDKRTNDQNNRSYMVNILSIVSNQIVDKSEIDVVNTFEDYYEAFHTVISPIVNTNEETEKDLVNYINITYLTSDKVSTKDRNTLVGEYDENKVTSVFELIDAITKYNYSSQNNYFGFEALLVEKNEYDVLALKFIESNSRRLLNTINQDTTYEDLRINPYYDNLCKFITKLENGFEHTYKDENGNEVTKTILYQNVSDSVVFVCDEIIRYTLSLVKDKQNLKDNEILETYYNQATTNSVYMIQYLQNTIYGECEKVDEKVYFKKSE